MDGETKDNEPSNAKKARTNLKLLAMAGVLLAGLVLGGAATYLNYNPKLKLRDDRISSLESRVAQLSDMSLPETPAMPDEPIDQDCEGGSAYSADVGKFSINLDSPRVIIRNLDGGFEGGPASILTIGTCLEGSQNVVDLFPTHEVEITGHPTSSSSELKTSYESQIGLALSPAGSMSVGGVTAQKYQAEGLFTSTVLYFDNAGIGYQIELTDTSDTTNQILNDLTDDWTFTP